MRGSLQEFEDMTFFWPHTPYPYNEMNELGVGGTGVGLQIFVETPSVWSVLCTDLKIENFLEKK